MATADEGMIKRDWAAHAQLGGRAGRPENSKFLEADQFEKLRNYVNHFADPKHIVLMIQTAMYSGARFGEIGGLTWEDIDEKKKRKTPFTSIKHFAIDSLISTRMASGLQSAKTFLGRPRHHQVFAILK